MPQEITIARRMRAAEKVADVLDRAVRRESTYGLMNAAGFDETMAISAIAHALGIWWSGATDEELIQRIMVLAAAIKGAWHNQRSGVSGSDVSRDNPEEPLHGG